MRRRLIRTTLAIALAFWVSLTGAIVWLDASYMAVEANELARAFEPAARLLSGQNQGAGLRALEPVLLEELGPAISQVSPLVQVHVRGLSYVVVVRDASAGPRELATATLDWFPSTFAGWLSLSCIVFLVALLFGLLLTWPIVRRVRAIEAGARAVAHGTWSTRVPVQGKDELAQLAVHFNDMAEQVQLQVQTQEALLHAVAHEARTPVATALFALALAEGACDAEDRAVQHGRLRKALADLESLTDEVTTYAGAAQDLQRSFGAFELQVLARSVADECEHGRTSIECELARVEIHGDARLLRRALRNLVDNAVRHARASVRLRLEHRDGRALLWVEDDGEGIAEADRSRVLEPFVRLDMSRSRHTGGHGLGLSIAARIVRLHDGMLRVDRGELGGARFTIDLPSAARRRGS